MNAGESPIRRFFEWRWWRGWRGWVVFAVVTAIVCTFAGITLVRTFSDPAEPWSEYPGVPQVSTDQILKNETVEELSVRVDAAMAEVREAITAEFGFTWSPKGEDTLEYVSNRFRGTSLLNSYDSVNWQTNGTLRSIADKQRAVEIAIEVMARNGFGDPRLRNTSGQDAVYEYGDFTLENQGRWLVTGEPPEVSRGSLQFTILDLSRDRTETLTQLSDFAVAERGWEPEYLSIAYRGDFMLKEADRAEFERRAEIYAGHLKPVSGGRIQ